MTPHRLLRRAPLVLALFVLLFALPTGAVAQSDTPGTGAPGDVFFEGTAFAVPLVFKVNAPAVLPIDVEFGIGASSATVTGVPFAQVEASPLYAPVLSAIGLLGGVGGLLGFLPGMLLGLPAVAGLPPVPVDPGVFPPFPPELVPLLSPLTPLLQSGSCVAFFPAEPHEVSCGGPSQDLGGVDGRLFNGRAVANELPGGLVEGIGSARGAGFAPTTTTFFPVTTGAMGSDVMVTPAANGVEVEAVASVRDIDIGGLVRIGELRSRVRATSEGTGELEAERCSVTQVSVLGVPATVDGDGIHAGDEGIQLPGVPSVQDQLDQALAQLNVELTFFPTPQRISGEGEQRGEVACLVATFLYPPSNSRMTITFGKSSAGLAASAGDRSPGTGGAGSALPSDTGLSVAGNQSAAASDSLAEATGVSTPPSGGDAQGIGELAAPVRTSSTECGLKCVYQWYMALALATPFLVRFRRTPRLWPRGSRPWTRA